MDDDNFLSAPESPSIMLYERLEDVIYAIRTFEKVSTMLYERVRTLRRCHLCYTNVEKMYFDRNTPSQLARRARVPPFADDVERVAKTESWHMAAWTSFCLRSPFAPSCRAGWQISTTS
jgi:hypothetical protein